MTGKFTINPYLELEYFVEDDPLAIPNSTKKFPDVPIPVPRKKFSIFNLKEISALKGILFSLPIRNDEKPGTYLTQSKGSAVISLPLRKPLFNFKENPPKKCISGLKVTEALAGGGPMLIREAQVRGIRLQDLIDKILVKSQSFSMMEAEIAGMCGKMCDMTKTMTYNELVDFDWRF